MAGKKSKKDFAKVKLKVGKVLKKGLNFTETSFKSKKIILREQLKEGVKGLKDQFISAVHKLHSTNPTVACEGLSAIKKLIDSLSIEQLGSLVAKLGPLCSSYEVQLRSGACSVLNVVLAKFSGEQKAAFGGQLMISLQCSMTHLDWGVKRDSLNLLNVLCEHIPDQIVRNFSIVENVMDLVSSTKENSRDRKLNVELQCTTNHLRLWHSVCRALNALVLSIIKTFGSTGNQRKPACLSLGTITGRLTGLLSTSAENTNTRDQGPEVARSFVPVLLDMWLGVESADSSMVTMKFKQDVLSIISVLMMNIVEWLQQRGNLQPNQTTLPDIVLSHFKPRFPIMFEDSPATDINLRLAKVMSTLHGGDNVHLNELLFAQFKQNDSMTNVKLVLDLASLLVETTPGVLEHLNDLFFSNKPTNRKPFYDFYINVIQKVEGKQVDRLLLKAPKFVSKIILMYPRNCKDEVDFLERIHCFLLPSYVQGLGRLSLSTLEQLIRITRSHSNVALRLVVDQRLLSRDHLRIIVDLWNEGVLSQEDVVFAVCALRDKYQLICDILPGADEEAMLLQMEFTKMFNQFCLSLLLDLGENLFSRMQVGQHANQRCLEFCHQIHDVVLQLSTEEKERSELDQCILGTLRANSFLQTSTINAIALLIYKWENSAESSLSSLTICNFLRTLYVFNDNQDGVYDTVSNTVDKLINQLFVSYFFQAELSNKDVLRVCLLYFESVGLGSFFDDMDRVMNAEPDECDDSLHLAFARSTKFFKEERLLMEDCSYNDLIEDALRVAESAEASLDSESASGLNE